MLFSVDGGPLTDNVVLNSVQRYLGARSRSVSYRDDKVSGFQGRLCVLALLHVILVLLARISIFETVASDKLQVI